MRDDEPCDAEVESNEEAGDEGSVSGSVASLAALARDPSIVPGIYEACDQWCAYCRATDRCLAFRATNAGDVGGVFTSPGPSDEVDGGGSLLLKILADAEGRLAPPEIEAVASGDPERIREVFSLDDPLERLGRRYMTVAEAYLVSRLDFSPDVPRRREGAAALDVLAWFHVLAPARVFRAILMEADARRHVPGRRTDARAAAKVALIGIDRSLGALEEIATQDDDPRLELLQGLLRRLRREVETRFPDARNYVRPGLDAEPAARYGFRHGLRRLRALLHWRDGRPAIDAAAGGLRGSAGRAGHLRG